MAIQTQIYPDNFGLSFGAGSQDYYFMDNNIYHNTNNTRDNVNNNLYNDLVFNLQQQQQEHECLVQFQNFHNPSLACCTTTSVHPRPSKNFSHGFAANLDEYNQEIDHYIVLQSERLKASLQGETKKQMGEIWRKLQVKGMVKMQRKNQEIAKATEKRQMLEESLAKVEAEKDAWRRRAVENESVVISMKETLKQVKEEHTSCSNMYKISDEKGNEVQSV